MAQSVQPGAQRIIEDEKQIDNIGYKHIFRESGDSLYLMMKDKQSRRCFSNTFSKSALVDMNIHQPIEEILNLLQIAKSGQSGFTFEVRYGDAENIKKVAIDKLSKSYETGMALYIFVSVKQSYFSAQYQFKLLQQGM